MWTRVVLYFLIAVAVNLFLTEMSRRIIAEIPCELSRAVVLLEPGGILALDVAGVDVNSVTVLSSVDFEVVPVGWRQERCRAILVARR